jgi:FtsH-binding integral membrane protein
MNRYDDNFSFGIPGTKSEISVNFRPLMRAVYIWMTLGLLATTAVSLLVNNNPSLRALSLEPGVMIGAIIAELVLVIALSLAINRLSPEAAGVMFFIYACVNGFTLSFIFMIYDLGSITAAFITAAGMFAAMSVVGFTTQVDLTRYRAYFMMGLIGLVIALVVNMFLRSSGLDLIISLFGVALFTGLTAYDTQRIRNMAANSAISGDGTVAMKISIIGALQLYLDFVNLFLYLLRLFGRRR